ncbi:MAG TPA: hypothetical protein VH268_12810 [Solirubrobacterales bacterium]|nr:hypothetical protein [Solirubrobacterales bacterium]
MATRNGEAGGTPVDRPSFYALRPGGWRDVVTVLHPPYTLWNVSNVAIGAAVAVHVYPLRLAAAVVAFFLAVGVAAHCLDELNGRPLGTQLSDRALVGLAVAGLGGALAIGIVGVFVVSPTLIPLILFGAFIAPAYNLEWFGGRFHTDLWLAISWAGFATFTGWWVNALGVHSFGEAVAVVGVVVGTAFLVTAQRRLSTPVRELRRRTVELTGTQRLSDGTVRPLRREDLVAPLDGALRALSFAVPLIAIGLLAIRL